MPLKSTLHNLTSSSSWLGGVLVVVVLFLLCLLSILIVRYLWSQKRLSIFYNGGAEKGVHYGHQYLVQMCFERDPRQQGHDRKCQVWSEVWYQKDSIAIIPFNLNKVCFYDWLQTAKY